MFNMIHSGAKYFSMSGPMYLENELSAPKMLWWDRHRIIVIVISIQKKVKVEERSNQMEERNESPVPSN